MNVYSISEGTRDLSPDIIHDGSLRTMPASYYATTSQQERALFGVKNAAYVLPTHELVGFLKFIIAGRSAIEIGSGNGVLARALNIQATDNHQQTFPHIAEYYTAMRQPTIAYGRNVERVDAMAAVVKYRPKVVVAAWVTHRFNEARPDLEGNQDGVDEIALLAACETYLFVGNREVHRNKPIWDLPHKIIEPDWAYSRAMNPSRNFIAAWGNTTGFF